MSWLDIILIILFILVLMGGVKDGAVKVFFSLLAFIIAIPLAGASYHLIAGLLSFLPGENWENFIGFFIALGIIVAIFSIVFTIPQKFIKTIWRKGCLFRLFGGLLNLFSSAVGLTLFSVVLLTWPIISWLEHIVTDSAILMWLVHSFSFVPAMLPEALHYAPQIAVLFTGG